MGQRIFWEGEATGGKGGYFFRTVGLTPFIKKVEESTGKKVVALAIDTDEDNLIEVIVEQDGTDE